jgi:hypothetical protein
MTAEMWIIAAFRVGGALPVLRWPLAGAFIALFTDLGDLFLRDWLDLGGVKDYQRFDKWLDQAYMLTFLAVALRWHALPRNIAVALYAFRLVGFVAFEISGDRDVLIFFPNTFEYWFIFIAAIKTFGWEEQEVRSKEPGARSQKQGKAAFGGSGSQAEPRPTPEQATPAEYGPIPAPQLSLSHDTPRVYYFHHWPIIGPIARFAIPYRYSRAQLLVACAVILAAKLFHEYTLHVGQWFESFTATEALEAIWRFFTPPY